MKPESHNQAKAPALPSESGQEDPRLWELLGRSTHAPAPDDFLSKVLSRVDELEATGAAPLSLAQRWELFLESLGGWGTYSGLRVAGALAIVALICGLTAWPLLHGGGRGATPQQVVTTTQERDADEGIDFTILEPGQASTRVPRDHVALQDAEMHTILQLDDYLALADQQAFLDTDATSYLQ